MKRLLIIILLLVPLVCFGQFHIKSGINQNGSGGYIPTSGYINSSDGYTADNSGGITFEAEALAYFARMDKTPADDTLKILNEFIDSLKKNGTYAKLDRIVITGLNTVYNATLDIKGGTSATLVNSPIFTPYKGITTDNGKYIKTEFIPVDSASHNYRMNSGFMGVWNNSTISGVTYRYLIGTFDGTRLSCIMVDNTGKDYALINGIPWGTSVTYASIIGLHTTSRISGTDNIVSVNDSIVTFTRNASVPLSPYQMYVGCVNLSGSNLYYANTTISLYIIGGGFTSQEVRNINSCVQRLKTKLGW